MKKFNKPLPSPGRPSLGAASTSAFPHLADQPAAPELLGGADVPTTADTTAQSDSPTSSVADVDPSGDTNLDNGAPIDADARCRQALRILVRHLLQILPSTA